MTTTLLGRTSIVDRDQWLEKQIKELCAKLLKQPKNNRGPFVISDAILNGSKTKTISAGKLKSMNKLDIVSETNRIPK